jgi:hypothetical protein
VSDERPRIGISAHARAARGVRRARARAGLAGFVIAAWIAHGAGLPAFDVLLRALLTGIGAHIVGWLFAIAYWRAAILAELETARVGREEALAAARSKAAADTVMRDAATSSALR